MPLQCVNAQLERKKVAPAKKGSFAFILFEVNIPQVLNETWQYSENTQEIY